MRTTAERAVRAGLRAGRGDSRELGDARADDPLAARIGIATGLVMVGELIGEGAAREQTVVGETPNLAARLQALAAPGSVVISQATRRLVGGLFELADLGPLRLKGFAEPLAAWRVEGEGRAEGRFEARQTAGLTPLVGRDEEIALLLRRWQQAKDGEGHVVLLSGEPGIGKSRLVREAARAARGRAARTPALPMLAAPHDQPAASADRAAGARGAVSRATIRPRHSSRGWRRCWPRGTDRPDQAVPLIAALLGVPTDGRYPALDLTPAAPEAADAGGAGRPARRARGGAAGAAAPTRTCTGVDPTTQELLGLTIERIQHLPVLLLITFRPEFQPPWSGQPHVSALAL